MSWVLTSERKPTADDADEFEHLWFDNDGEWQTVNYRAVRAHPETYSVWHPKPKAEKPEPYVPPVPERFERWLVVSGVGGTYGVYNTRLQAEGVIRKLSSVFRIVHVREVRDGDPSPEDVAEAVGVLKLMQDYGVCRASIDQAIKLLGGG
jgi:hypothetical protein